MTDAPHDCSCCDNPRQPDDEFCARCRAEVEREYGDLESDPIAPRVVERITRRRVRPT